MYRVSNFRHFTMSAGIQLFINFTKIGQFNFYISGLKIFFIPPQVEIRLEMPRHIRSRLKFALRQVSRLSIHYDDRESIGKGKG